MDTVADLQAARRYTTSVLLNLDLDVTETSVSTLLTLLDHFIENPSEYLELINAKRT